MARKKYFFVFCAIFFALALALAWGAWRKQAELQAGSAIHDDPSSASIERLSDPPPPPASRAAAPDATSR